MHSRMLPRKQQGFSALLLIQILCGIAVVAAILIPLVTSYRDGEKMRTVNLHYRVAIDMVSEQHVADRIRRSTGDDSTSSPDDTAAWIALLSKDNPEAPGGGPAFIESSIGSSATGAIGVIFDSKLVLLAQPPYLELDAHRVEIKGFEVREIGSHRS